MINQEIRNIRKKEKQLDLFMYISREKKRLDVLFDLCDAIMNRHFSICNYFLVKSKVEKYSYFALGSIVNNSNEYYDILDGLCFLYECIIEENFSQVELL